MSRSIHYRHQLDLLTDEIMKKSSSTIQKIDENVKLAHSLRSSNSLISQMDLQINNLTTNLQHYQSILTQLNSLLVRSEYFEIQLNSLETANDESDDQGWKDNDLSWKTTEATLENLFLEFRFLSRKIDSLATPCYGTNSPFRVSTNSASRRVITSPAYTNHSLSTEESLLSPLKTRSDSFSQSSTLSFDSHQFSDQKSVALTGSFIKRSSILGKSSFSYMNEDDESELEEEQTTVHASEPSVNSGAVPVSPKTEISESSSNHFNPKPIRCTSSSVTDCNKRMSMELKSFNLLAMKTSVYLPTPDTTLNDTNDTTIFSNSSQLDNHDISSHTILEDESSYKEPKSPMIVKAFKLSPLKPVVLTVGNPEKRHSRRLSLPQSVLNIASPDGDHNWSKPANLRHFISHDTGLKVRGRQGSESSVEEDVKESQFVNSPVEEMRNMSFYKMGKTKARLRKEEAVIAPKTKAADDRSVSTKPVIVSPTVTIFEEEKETDEISEEISDEVDQFQLPTFEHKLNRSNSCDSIFSSFNARQHVAPKRNNQEQTMSWMKKFSSTASITRETDISAISTTASSSISLNTSKALQNLVSHSNQEEYISLTNLIQPSPLSWQSLWAKKSKPAATLQVAQPSIPPGQIIRAMPSNISSASSSLSQPPSTTTTNTSQGSSQWTSLFSRFKPDSIVTSEVGRPIKPIPIKKASTSGNSTPHVSLLEYPHRSERLKGSASTITIGPNGSKFVNHGESSTLGQSLVVSSRVSHIALRDALNDDLLR